MMICVECKHHFSISKKSINIFSEQLLYIYIYIYIYILKFILMNYIMVIIFSI